MHNIRMFYVRQLQRKIEKTTDEKNYVLRRVLTIVLLPRVLL